MSRGIFTSVGVGPGDPGLITVAAVEAIRTSAVIAVPVSGAADNAVLKIAAAYLEGKEIMYCDMPMTRDREKLEKSHEKAAADICERLEAGDDVAFLTLGDPSIYSTTMYVHDRIRDAGYETKMIAGVPSFCAAAARIGIPLCEGGEKLTIVPASYSGAEEAMKGDGNKVLMKSGKSICAVRDAIDKDRFDCYAVERCGMEGERVHMTLDTVDDSAGYFSLLIMKEKRQ